VRLDTIVSEEGGETVLVHFARRRGDSWTVACTPNLAELHAANGRLTPWHRSDDPRAVTCPLCINTPAYGLASAALSQR
jgi:hypothetical protein